VPFRPSARYLLAIAQVDLKVLREMRLGAHLRSERAEEDETAFKIIEVCTDELRVMDWGLGER
jgi:hypothetical protein